MARTARPFRSGWLLPPGVVITHWVQSRPPPLRAARSWVALRCSWIVREPSGEMIAAGLLWVT